MIKINFKVTENEVTKINQIGDSTTGSIGQIKCTFDLDPVYTDLTCVAVFNNIKIPMIRGVCYADNIPEGRCVVGVYAYDETEGTVNKRISPKPCVIVVDRGSYLEGHDPEPPTASETERFYNLINEAISSGQIKGEKGDKGDKGDPGIQGSQGVKGDTGESGLLVLSGTSPLKITTLGNHLYYTATNIKLQTLSTVPMYLELPQGTFLLVEKEVDSYNEINLLRITIWGSCTFDNVEYKYGIHQYRYNTIGGIIENSFVLDTKGIETEIANLEANKQDNLTAGAGITITDKGVISSDVGLKMIVLGDGEELPPPYEGEENTIYFKRNTTEEESDDWYEEYILVDSGFELIGTTKIDLSAYAQKTEVPTKTSELENDSNFVSDEKYVHTDENFTAAEKKKLGALANYDDTAIKEQIAKKQDKLSKKQLENISAVPNKIGESQVGNGLKFENGQLQLDIPVATASTTYGGDAQ